MNEAVKDKLENSDEYFMSEALKLARESSEQKEVPVGAVIVMDGEIVGFGKNMREGQKNALCHAEIAAIDAACKKLGGWRLHKCELFVTLEPCPMCAGAIMNSRIKRVVYGTKDSKAGAYGSLFDLNSFPVNHKPEITSGVLEKECSDMLSDFFAELRLSKKVSNKNSEGQNNG